MNELGMRGFIGGLVIGLVIGVVLAATTPSSKSSLQSSQTPGAKGSKPGRESKVSWKMASAFPGDMPIAGKLAKTVIKRLKNISNGQVSIEFHEPGALVPAFDLFDAVASGVVDAGFASPALWGSKSAAFELFSAVPFGPETNEYLAWLYSGGGDKIIASLYNGLNIHSVLCGATGMAGGGWFNREIAKAEDLVGLNIAATGLAAAIYRSVGAKPKKLAPSDIPGAVKQNELDGVSFSMPSIDRYLDLGDFAKYYYFPGWHQQSGIFDLIINLAKWNELSDRQKTLIETACAANVQDAIALGEAGQFGALKKIVLRGVEVKKWPDEVTRAMKRAWIKVASRKSASDKNFKRAYRSLKKFREDYSIWRDLGKIKP